MELSLKVLETNSSFKKKILLAICEELTLKLLLISKKVRDDIAAKIAPAFQNTQEYDMLLNDQQVRADFGFRPRTTQGIIDGVIQRIADSIEVTFTPLVPRSNSIKGGLTVSVLLSNFSDVLALSKAKFTSNGHSVDWLDWLLLQGDRIIIQNYHVEYGVGLGRSYKGHMEKTGIYSINSKISGTANNNWLTRAILSNEIMITDMMTGVIQHHLDRIL